MNKHKILMFFFVGSEAFFFLALIVSYVYYSHPGGHISPTAKYLDIEKTSIFTTFLLSSSLTVWLAGRNMAKKKTKAVAAWLIATIVLGATFLIGQTTEYLGLFALNITISKNVFGSSFFTLTGFHGLHVLIGLIMLSILLGIIISGKFKMLESTALESGSIYWHFVDAVWIVVFSVVYIGAIL